MSSLILAALHDEIREFKNKMAVDCTVHFQPGVFYRGKVFEKEASLLVTGIGAKHVERGLASVLRLERPDVLLLAGCCGGASPVAGNGKLVLVDRVADAQSEKEWRADKNLLEAAKKISEVQKISYQIGGMAAVDRVIIHPHEKADLGATHSVIALDMESAAVARFAVEHKIPWLAAKAVLDPVEERLPPLEGCYDAMGEARWGNLAEHFLKDPKAMMQLPKMIYWASQARHTITKFLEGWVMAL